MVIKLEDIVKEQQGWFDRLTLAEPTQQKVRLLWQNETVLGVFGNFDKAWEALCDLMKDLGGVWIKLDMNAEVWTNREGTTLRIEAREVHR